MKNYKTCQDIGAKMAVVKTEHAHKEIDLLITNAVFEVNNRQYVRHLQDTNNFGNIF